SPSLSPIRYSCDTSRINQTQPNEKSTNLDDNIILVPIEEIQSNQTSLPIDDSLLKVGIFCLKKKALSILTR
ncbi:unnamed protein product, partial [Rotaria magnacalcarata]